MTQSAATAADTAAAPPVDGRHTAAPADVESAAADIPPYRYTAALANEIEPAGRIAGRRTAPSRRPTRTVPWRRPTVRGPGTDKLYLLDMFPYPSGAGLHVGHPLGYIGTDVHRPVHADDRPERAAHHRLRRVRPARGAVCGAHRHPPADHHRGEHRAIPGAAAPAGLRARPAAQRRHHRPGVLPLDPVDLHRSCSTPGTTLPPSRRGRSAPWSRSSPAGCAPRPDGRPWAELTFAEQHRVLAGYRLAYIDEAPVNWCPGLGTVLSNEEITADGRSAIGNFPVFRRSLRQWMMRITAYADRLIDDLDRLDWPESVKSMQRNWIGRSYRGHRPVRDCLHVNRCPAMGPIRSRSTPPGRTRCSAPPTWCWRRNTRWSTRSPRTAWPAGTDTRWTGGAATPGPGGRRLPAGRLPQVRSGPSGEPGQDGRLHRRVRREPGQRQPNSRSLSPTTC